MLSVLLAVLASVGNAVASVLQRKANAERPEEHEGALAMLWRLSHRPVWIGGIAALVVGVLLQAAALATGPVALVQPILVLELPFSLVVARLVFRSPLHVREWGAIIGMSAGLAALLYALQPAGGNASRATTFEWVLGVAAALAVCAACVVIGYRSIHARRAVFFGLATGFGFGLTAVLLASVGAAYLRSGIDGVLTSPSTYLLVVLGPGFFFLLQKTLQAGSLVAAQPALTLSDPVVAILFGVIVFGESVRTDGWLALAVAGAALIAVCTAVLARSPLLHGEAGARSDIDAGG